MNKLRITDLSNDFTINPMTGDLAVKKDIDAIKQSMKNLLLLEKFDKPFKPDIDAGIKEFLFESFPQAILRDLIDERVRYIISRYEPRVELEKVESVLNENLLTINVEFKLVNNNNLGSQTLQILLERVR
jgi:phage baseplate assembly protein W